MLWIVSKLLTTDERIERQIVTESYHQAIGEQSHKSYHHYDALHQSREGRWLSFALICNSDDDAIIFLFLSLQLRQMSQSDICLRLSLFNVYLHFSLNSSKTAYSSDGK